MSKSAHDGAAVIKPGQTYVGKRGFTYGAGASAETVGAQKVCMNVLPMSPGAVAKAHYHEASKRSRTCSKANASCTTAMILRSGFWYSKVNNAL
jgi:uncharacterized RmlC-like cupin family protein